MMLYPVLLTAFLMLANYWNGRQLLKYVFSLTAFVLFYIPVQIYDIKLQSMERVIYLFPLIFSYLLPDTISPNVFGILLAQLVSTCFGKEDNSYVAGQIILILYTSISFSVVFYLVRKLTLERDEYRKISITDSLTRLLTLSHFMEQSAAILDKTPEYAILLINIDHFKQLNDNCGHLAGNEILIEFSDLLRKELMDADCVIGRLGGDEFVILLHDLTYKQVETTVERLYLSNRNKVFYINSSLPPLKISITIGRAISTRQNKLPLQELINQAENNMLCNKYGEYKLSQNSVLNKISLPDKCRQLLKTLSEKDAYTCIHSQFVAQYASELAAALGLPKKMIKDIYISGLMHDIGKLYIPNAILKNPEELTVQEYAVIKEHVTDSLEMLHNIELSEATLNGIKYHHERFDGSGYPYRINGSFTPVEGRIMQIADAFSAMTIKRAYKESLSLGEAVLELKRNSSSQFDPELVDIFIALFNEKLSAI